MYMYVCLCVYVCMYACMSVCVYVCMYVCVCMYMCMYVCVHVCMYMYACMYVYVCVCICMYSYVCMCMYVYVCVSANCSRNIFPPVICFPPLPPLSMLKEIIWNLAPERFLHVAAHNQINIELGGAGGSMLGGINSAYAVSLGQPLAPLPSLRIACG